MAKQRPSKRLRQQPRKARARPRKASGRRAVEAALAGIVHDIRTPLTGIVALTELLATSDVGAHDADGPAIKNGADHLAALTTLIVDAVRRMLGLTLPHEPFSPRAGGGVGRSRADRARRQQTHKDRNRLWAALPAMVAGDACGCARRWKTSPTTQ